MTMNRDGRPVDVDDLFESDTIRCANHAAEPKLCGADCGVAVRRAALNGGSWVRAVCEAGWFVTIHGHGDHRHVTPFCSVTCFSRWAAREYPPDSDEEDRGDDR
jgi:hypothetical protein